jgi:restriction system protein
VPIPDFQTLMLPLLNILSDGQERHMREVTATLADRFELTEEERQRLLPSGQNKLFLNRVAWAKSHLKAAGLIENPSRGKVRIADEGRQVLASHPDRITVAFLRTFPSYLAFAGQTANAEATTPDTAAESAQESTPRELLDASYQALRKATAEELLARLRACSPGFFEKAVVKLLLAMGYGGVAGERLVTGGTGDGGVDGLIKEDKLGLDVVCLQAKRWENTVGRPVVQGFVGSMDFVRARKGVILTTSTFSSEAVNFVEKIEGKKVVLIDGERLAELMLEHGVGVATTQTYELKEVSNDFFDEDEA